MNAVFADIENPYQNQWQNQTITGRKEAVRATPEGQEPPPLLFAVDKLSHARRRLDELTSSLFTQLESITSPKCLDAAPGPACSGEKDTQPPRSLIVGQIEAEVACLQDIADRVQALSRRLEI